MATAEPTDVPVEGFHSRFFERLATYSVVDFAVTTTGGYYTRIKKANKYLEYGFDKAESLTAFAAKTAQPLLSKVDDFGLNQLVRAEETLSGTYQKATKLPYSLVDKALDFGEESLDYWLPVEGVEAHHHDKDDVEPLTLTRLGSRTRHVLDSFQVRAKDKLYTYPAVASTSHYVTETAKYVKTKATQVKNLPTTVRQKYTDTKNAVLNRLKAYYAQLTLILSTVFDRASTALAFAKREYEAFKEASWQDRGILLVNNLHRGGDYLYENFYPKKLLQPLHDRVQQFLTKKNVKPPTENGDHKKKKPVEEVQQDKRQVRKPKKN